MSKRNLYLAIALTTRCNYECFYCKKGGESMCCNEEEIPIESLKRILKVAYSLGISNFRITGGEPTMVSYLEELLKFILEKLGSDTKIRLNTNGYNLYNFTEIIEQYKERIYVIISVDTLSKNLGGFYYPKYLSEKIQKLTKDFVSKGIKIRYNVVVTRANASEIEKLIIMATENLGVDIKLLDLNKYEQYLEKSIEWNNLYISIKELQPLLEKVGEQYHEKYFQSNSFGIPMYAYFRNGHMIQVKDSTRGASYSESCYSNCKYYNMCMDGVFSPFISANMMLHLSGCRNEKLHFNLKGKGEVFIKNSFRTILKLFEKIEMRKR